MRKQFPTAGDSLNMTGPWAAEAGLEPPPPSLYCVHLSLSGPGLSNSVTTCRPPTTFQAQDQTPFKHYSRFHNLEDNRISEAHVSLLSQQKMRIGLLGQSSQPTPLNSWANLISIELALLEGIRIRYVGHSWHSSKLNRCVCVYGLTQSKLI